MSKYFKNNDELKNFIMEKFQRTFDDMLLSQDPSDYDIINALIKAGYTDLDNLIEDGHAYQIGEHANNGWIYEYESDIEYLKQYPERELRKR